MSGDAQDEYVELEQLRTAMQTRPTIDRASGVLMAAYGLTPDDAWEILVTVSQHSNTKLRTVAAEIEASPREGLTDGRLRTEIEAAIKDLRAR